MKFCRARLGLYLTVAVGSLLLSSNALALTVTYGWVPDDGSSGSGTMVISDVNITDDQNFGSPGAVVNGTSLVSLTYTYPVNGVSVSLSDFDENNVDLGNAVGPDGWTASGGEISNVFLFVGRTQALKDMGVRKIRVSQGATNNGLNDLLEVFNNTQGIVNEGQTGHWEFVSSVPEPNSALLIAMGLAGLGWRGRAKRS